MFSRNPKFSTNYKATIFGGDSACPPEPPPALCDCVVLPSLELSFQWGCHAAGVEAFHAVASRALRKIF
jgi:hypothetical protein